MDMNGTERSTGLDWLVQELEQQILEAEAVVANLREQIAPHEEELRKMRKMLNAAVPAVERPQRGQTPRKRMGEEELKITVSRLRQLPQAEWIDPAIPGSFTERSFAENLGLSKDTANRMVTYMREQETIRLVGERKMPGAPRPSRVYTLVTDGE